MSGASDTSTAGASIGDKSTGTGTGGTPHKSGFMHKLKEKLTHKK